jgi:activator of 2-hydroxyglutaryl-CoA dehydratase
MRSAEIDIGSRAIKLVLWDDMRVVHRAIEDTGSDPLAEKMALGVHHAIATRTVGLAGAVQMEDSVVFTGGCACNPCLVSAVSAALKRPLRVPESPQTVAALGCALFGNGGGF